MWLRQEKEAAFTYYYISPNVLVYASMNELCPEIKFLLIPSKIGFKTGSLIEKFNSIFLHLRRTITEGCN